MGSLGLGGAGNINPEKDFPSMFEPIHGSAPDIAGLNIANPFAPRRNNANYRIIQHIFYIAADVYFPQKKELFLFLDREVKMIIFLQRKQDPLY